LLTRKTAKDHTLRMKKWISKRLKELEKEELCGFVFKSRSPSSGMQGVKVYTESGQPGGKGSGLFAGAFMKRFPLLPVEDDGRLNDAGLRENFIERIFVFSRWKRLFKKNSMIRNLVDFHTDHKYVVMAHSPQKLRELGRLVAGSGSRISQNYFDDYFRLMMETLKLKATVKKNTNVLVHLMGYFKKQLSADEKRELLSIIENYYHGLVPLVVPVTLIRHFVRKYQDSYLKRQVYLNPHPNELMLRNHV